MLTIFKLIIGSIGAFLVWKYGSIYIMLGVFLMMWANNIDYKREK